MFEKRLLLYALARTSVMWLPKAYACYEKHKRILFTHLPTCFCLILLMVNKVYMLQRAGANYADTMINILFIILNC